MSGEMVDPATQPGVRDYEELAREVGCWFLNAEPPVSDVVTVAKRLSAWYEGAAARAPLEATVAALREAIMDLMENRDCAFCDHGVLRKRVDGREAFHADDCPWWHASAAVNDTESAARSYEDRLTERVRRETLAEVLALIENEPQVNTHTDGSQQAGGLVAGAAALGAKLHGQYLAAAIRALAAPPPTESKP